MARLTAARCIVGLCLASSLMACSKGQDSGSGSGGAVAVAVEGCGKDYGDPQKQFCVTLPAGYKVDPKIDSDALYAELIRFTGDNMGDGMTITLGAEGARTYEAVLTADETFSKTPPRKIEASGPTPGNGGKWWITLNQGYHQLTSTVKAPNGKAVGCAPSNTTPSPAAVEACKSVRPYPTKS